MYKEIADEKEYSDLQSTRRRTRRPLGTKEVRGIPLGVGEDADGPAVDDEFAIFDFDGTLEAAVGRIVHGRAIS